MFSILIGSGRGISQGFPLTAIRKLVVGRKLPPASVQYTSLLKGRRKFHATYLNAAPKRGSIVDSYQTVTVRCNSCKEKLFRYKKKNGTKSSLVKCYLERICEDPNNLLEQVEAAQALTDLKWNCPNCGVTFARNAVIHGRPALKLVGGKTRMTKK